MSDPNELREDLKLYAAASAVRNQERQLDEQRRLVARAAEVEANSARRAVLSKLTDLLIDGAASDYKDEAFLKKLRVFLGSTQAIDLSDAVLDELKSYPSVLDFAYEVFVARGGIKVAWSAPDGSSGELPIEAWATDRYRFGIDGATQDLSRALRFARIGAERKIAECMGYVGEALAHGLACDRNVEDAVSALKQAAQWGSSEAFVSLARLHEAESNTAEMVEALRAGNARFPNDAKLALMLAEADAVWTDKDTEQRLALYEKAASGVESVADIDLDWTKYLGVWQKFISGQIAAKRRHVLTQIRRFKEIISQCPEPQLVVEASSFCVAATAAFKKYENKLFWRDTLLAVGGTAVFFGLLLWWVVRSEERSAERAVSELIERGFGMHSLVSNLDGSSSDQIKRDIESFGAALDRPSGVPMEVRENLRTAWELHQLAFFLKRDQLMRANFMLLREQLRPIGVNGTDAKRELERLALPARYSKLVELSAGPDYQGSAASSHLPYDRAAAVLVEAERLLKAAERAAQAR